jgi:hypothetical protein
MRHLHDGLVAANHREHGPLMRWFGDGPTLWRVRVVLKAGNAQPGHIETTVERLRGLLAERPGEADPWDVGGEFGQGETGDATIGASFWVRAADVGAAARFAVTTMTATCEAVTGERHGLYEVNLVPHDAVVRPSGQTAVFRRLET